MAFASLLSGCKEGFMKNTVELNYTTGLTERKNYDHDIYGMNGMRDTIGSDPGAFYVSEKDDPEYGGYYYMYLSDQNLINDEQTGLEVEQVMVRRSKDMYNWERCGVYEDGRCLQIYKEDWVDNVNTTAFWAPEVIRNPADGKYYLYFTGIAKIGQVPGASTAGTNNNKVDSENFKDRMFLGVAVSDTPVGPFNMVYDIDEATGNRIPTMNFTQAYNSSEAFRILDGNPFFDDDGTFYLYFVRHDGRQYKNNRVCGVKMKDMAHPDYDTFSYLTQPFYKTVNFKVGDDPTIVDQLTAGCEKYYTASATPEFYRINEGSNMVKYNGKYYMTYTEGKYRAANYSVHVAVSDDPLQNFTKLDPDEGGQVCFGGLAGNINGTGHHSMVKNTDTGEWWIIYHRHGDTNEWIEGVSVRNVCSDRICWVTNDNVDFEVPTTNGPLYGLNWLSESATGYANLAQTATVTVNAGSGAEYLTDGLLPFYKHVQDRIYEVYKSQPADGKIEIKLSWDKPVDVSSVMVYNAYGKEEAFGAIAQMTFTLAEQTADSNVKGYEYAVIKNVALPDIYWDADTQRFSNCAPIVARFEPVSVTEIAIIIDSSLLEDSTKFNINEVVVLGKE